MADYPHWSIFAKRRKKNQQIARTYGKIEKLSDNLHCPIAHSNNGLLKN